MAKNGTLSPSQIRAIAALLSERDVRSAAAKAQVSERALYRWLKDSDFKARLREQEGEIIDQATRRLLQMQADAMGVLEEILTGATATDANKLRAAEGVLDFLVKLRELRNLEERMAELEERVSEAESVINQKEDEDD